MVESPGFHPGITKVSCGFEPRLVLHLIIKSTLVGSIISTYMKMCENVKCKKKHEGTYGSGKFCSRACANSRSWSKADRLKKSESSKRSELVRAEQIRRRKDDKTCPMCLKKFKPRGKNTIYCSKMCFKSDTECKFRNKSPGGYRRGAGRSKSGWYKGIWCDSTYELVYLIYCIDHNIPIKRCEKRFEYMFNGKQHFYHPDFIVNDHEIIEIKGRIDERFEAKKRSCRDVTILFKEDLKRHFEYVNVNYTTKHVDLYEGHPKYEYRCNRCEKLFVTNIKRKTLKKHCSKDCKKLRE